MEGEIAIRELRKTDLSLAAEILGKAFSTNPNSLATSGGRPVSAQKLKYAFLGRLKYLPGWKYVAELDGRIVGAMRIVEWPACQASFAQTLRTMPYSLKAIEGLSGISRGMQILKTWKKNDPKRLHFHLEPLGVSPEVQGRGIGSNMMEFYCQIIDKKGIEAYHETDRPENVPFYEKFGFKVVGEDIIAGAKNWYLLRPTNGKTILS